MNKKKLIIENIFFAFAIINFIIFIIHYILIINSNNEIDNNATNNFDNKLKFINDTNNTNNISNNELIPNLLYNFYDKNNNFGRNVYHLYSIQLNQNESLIDYNPSQYNKKNIDKNKQKNINCLIILLLVNFGFILMFILKILMNYIKIKNIEINVYLPFYVKPLLNIFSFFIFIGAIVCFKTEKKNNNIKNIKNIGITNIILSLIISMKFGIKIVYKIFNNKLK